MNGPDDQLVYVYLNQANEDILLGYLWPHLRNGRASASFQYANSYLAWPLAFALEPALPLREGSFHTEQDKVLFASFADTTPATWGRMLLKRWAKFLAIKEERGVQHLNEIDYLLAVHDFGR